MKLLFSRPRFEEPQDSGSRAEDDAADFLCAQGLVLKERNFHRRLGEIDLIFLDTKSQQIVFTEVRYRSNLDFGGAIQSITKSKSARLIKTARAWLQRNADSAEQSARIDVIAIEPDEPHGGRQKTSLPCDPSPWHWRGCRVYWIKNAIETT